MNIIEGRVTSVFIDGGSVYCNVNVLNTHNQDLQRVRVARPTAGFLAPPAQGDDVLVTELDDGSQYVTSVLTRAEIEYPALAQDELTLRFGTDGELTISEGASGYELLLNGAAVNIGQGGLGAITDVTTTKDANGKVTDITLVRSNKTTIE